MERELTDEEDEKVSKCSYLMAQQWSDWPNLIFSGIGPLFLLNPFFQNKLFFWHVHIYNKLFSLDCHINNIIILFIFIEIIWFFTAEKLISFKLAYWFRWIPLLTFITCPAAAIILFMKGHVLTAVLALLWHFFLTFISFLIFLTLSFVCGYLYSIPPPRIEIIQIRMKAAIIGLSQEETDYYVDMAKMEMRKNKL